MDMDKCAFLYGVSNHEGFDIKIEIHHYPFSLEDIVEIVVRKRQFYQEDMSAFMVAKEVMSLHYKLMIGLIPLSETVHELNHNHRIFIPIDKLMGRYRLFVEAYKQFITPEQLEMYNLKGKKSVDVKLSGEKGGIISNVHLKVQDEAFFELHLDLDDANAHLVNQGDIGEIL